MLMRSLTPNFEFWQRNLRALEKSNPQAAELLLGYSEDEKYSTFSLNINEQYAELRDTEGITRFLELRGKSFLEIDGGRKEDINLYVGFGLGYSFAHTITQERMNRAVIVETDPALLYWCMHIHEMEGLLASPGISWVVGKTSIDRENQWRQVFQRHGGLLNQAPCVFVHNTKNSNNRIDEVREIIREFKTALGGEIQSQFIDAERAYREMAHNIVNGCTVRHRGMVPLTRLKELWHGKPAIIVSAGPSLDKQIPLLKEAQHFAVIIANDVIAQGLFEAGVIPHAIVALDSSRIIYERMKPIIRDFREEASHTVFVAGTKVHPALVATWPGPVSLTNCDALGSYLAGVMKMPDIRSGLCVSHLCFHLAEALQPSEIVFIGQDLAYGPDGQTHASSFGHHEYGQKGFAAVQSWDKSTTVETNDHWYSFLVYFERCIASTQTPVYNCTEGGAWIEGAIHLSFAQRIENWKEKHLAVSYEKSEEETLESGVDRDRAACVAEEIEMLQHRCADLLEEIQSMYRQGLNLSLKNLHPTSVTLFHRWQLLWYDAQKVSVGLQSIMVFSKSGEFWNRPFPDTWKHKDFTSFWAHVYEDVAAVAAYLERTHYLWIELALSEEEGDALSSCALWREIKKGEDEWWEPWIESCLDSNKPLIVGRLLLTSYLAGLDKDLNIFIEWVLAHFPGFLGEWCMAWKKLIEGELNGYIEIARLIFAVRHNAYQVTEAEIDGAMSLMALLPALLRSFAVYIEQKKGGESAFNSLLVTLLDGEASFWEGDQETFNRACCCILDAPENEPFHQFFKKSAGGNWAAWTAERFLSGLSKEKQEKYAQKISFFWGVPLKKAEKTVDI